MTAAVGQIVLDFPTGQSLGKVYLLRPQFDGTWARQYITTRFVDARGRLAFPADAKLALIGGYGLTDGMQLLGKLPPDSLCYLDLRRLEIKSDDLASIVHLKNLQELDLQNTDVDDGAIKYLSGMPGLINIGLSKTLIKGQTLSQLERCPNLIIVDIGRTPFEIKYMDAFLHLKNLRHLSVEACHITDKEMQIVGKLSKLGSLAISENSQITSRGLASLTQLKELHYLIFTGVRIDEAGFAVISKLPLVMLTLHSNQISKEQLQKLTKAMPKTKIVIKEVGNIPIDLFEPVHKMQ